jgi:hypothetical protein
METDLVHEILCLRKRKMMDTAQDNGHVYSNVPLSETYGLGFKRLMVMRPFMPQMFYHIASIKLMLLS